MPDLNCKRSIENSVDTYRTSVKQEEKRPRNKCVLPERCFNLHNDHISLYFSRVFIHNGLLASKKKMSVAFVVRNREMRVSK